MIRAALISQCGLYRYKLSRMWDSTTPSLRFVMLNPSTADADLDDPTIRRCIGFARREGYGGIEVLNLYAFRATKPEALKVAADPFGPDNETYLDHLAGWTARVGLPIVLAWGTKGAEHGPKLALRLSRLGADLRCLGLTKDGHPNHPLYLPSYTPLVPVAVSGGRLVIREAA